MKSKRKVIGILGGMGPDATADLFQKITRHTRASRDQDHCKVIVISNPNIPDRTAYILGRGETPLPALIRTARDLETAGADFIVMPCNTAHYFHGELCRHVAVPVINMVAETAGAIAAELGPGGRVGLLASLGTVQSGLYETACRVRGFALILPSDREVQAVHRMIYEFKGNGAGHDYPELAAICRSLAARGAQGLVLGCTELPVMLKADLGIRFFDPTDILARKAVAMATAGG